jgi:hypothetical protein
VGRLAASYEIVRWTVAGDHQDAVANARALIHGE